MTKQEFLSALREALEGNVPRSEMEENIRFYDNYFRESSQSQEAVCEELGDPRLIARTIIDSFAAAKGPMADYYTEQARSEFSREERSYDSRAEYGREQNASEEKWYDKLFRILMLAVVLVIVAAVCVLLLKVTVYVVIPVVLVVLFIKIILDLFRRY